jgi:hypothetical protein
MPETLSESLREAQKDLELERIAESIRTEALHDWRQAAPLVLSFEGELAAKSSELLQRGDEMSVTPLTDDALPLTAGQDVMTTQMLAVAQIRVRQIIAAALPRLLNDRRQMPPPERRGTPPETPPVVRRVCDEAYLLLRRLANISEDQDQYIFNSDAFLSLPEAERDQEIVTVNSGGPWKVWVEVEAEE